MMNEQQPTVAYLIMAYNPMYWYRGILNALDQDYPNELKTVYLMLQELDPPQLPTNIEGMTVRQFVVGHKWPRLWFEKYLKFLSVVTEPIMLVWDEDDYYLHDYTRKALQPFADDNVRITGNLENIDVLRGHIERGQYPSAAGTFCGEVSIFHEAFEYLNERFPDHTAGGTGALDSRLRRWIQEERGDVYASHTGIRCYFRHRGAQTKGGRPPEQNIDFGWEGY